MLPSTYYRKRGEGVSVELTAEDIDSRQKTERVRLFKSSLSAESCHLLDMDQRLSKSSAPLCIQLNQLVRSVYLLGVGEDWIIGPDGTDHHPGL